MHLFIPIPKVEIPTNEIEMEKSCFVLILCPVATSFPFPQFMKMLFLTFIFTFSSYLTSVPLK